MATKRAFNPTDGPVVVDSEGRTVDGHGWGDVDSTDDAVKGAVDDGRLLLLPVSTARTSKTTSSQE